MAKKSIYTYDDFMKALDTSGLGGQFSQADLNLARQNPDAGMSLISYKTDYANATTDELRALANQGAETVRASYGGYTGGGDGGSFKLEPMSPNQFTYSEAPAFEDNWAGQIDDALQRQMNRDPYSYSGVAPEYESRYDPDIQKTISGILDRGEFSYDPKTDPVYSAYQKQYAREGQRATANAMGEAAAMTGGMPSSWAMTAASQAGDYYASQMADKIPELYQDAYNRYLQEYQMKLSDLNALRGLESDDYAKYRDQLAQYNTDREFDYGTWLDQQQLSQQDIDNLRALRSDDLALYQTRLGQYNTDRGFDYGQWLDEIENQRTRREDERSWAQNAAAAGDYSWLENLGVNMDKARQDDAMARALQAAQVGDYSALRALGYDVSTSEEAARLENAYRQAQIANAYASMPTEEDRALERQYRQAQIANAYASIPTEEEREMDRQYKQAQIEKMLNGGSDAEMTENQRVSRLLEAAKMALNAGDYETYAALMQEAGYGGDAEAAQRYADEQAGAKMKLKSADDLDDVFDYVLYLKSQGDESVKDYAAAKALITGLAGYNDKAMGEKVKEFLAKNFAEPFDRSTAGQSPTRRGTGSGSAIREPRM